MKLPFLVSFFLLILATTSFSAQESYTLTIEIEGIKKQSGNVLVLLSNSEKSFLKDGEGRTLKVKGNTVTANYKVAKGEYAFSFFHDKNSNGKLDTNFMGIPKESYGFSNNAKGFMGPPSYQKAKFSITGDTKVTVSF
ncbi:MAG: hypothetical protein CMB99_05060 [Flavobacteriaceae bacterium]|nr:hypothetical protein [Flavobacteriaceae bacterium]|tara:strand:+ start:89075 stop:89488 length:414 start_codon:yes stop_codon:yes gene_type:complete